MIIIGAVAQSQQIEIESAMGIGRRRRDPRSQMDATRFPGHDLDHATGSNIETGAEIGDKRGSMVIGEDVDGTIVVVTGGAMVNTGIGMAEMTEGLGGEVW